VTNDIGFSPIAYNTDKALIPGIDSKGNPTTLTFASCIRTQSVYSAAQPVEQIIPTSAKRDLLPTPFPDQPINMQIMNMKNMMAAMPQKKPVENFIPPSNMSDAARANAPINLGRPSGE
jgi:hypothetical protein